MRARTSKSSDLIRLNNDIIVDVLCIDGAQIRVGVTGPGLLKILRNELTGKLQRVGNSRKAVGDRVAVGQRGFFCDSDR